MVTIPTGGNVDRRSVLKGAGAVGVAALAGCTGGGNGDGGNDIVRFHAGGQSGTYYPLAGEFESIIEEETDYDVEVSSTGASVENVGSLGNGDADFALVQNDVAYFAFEGTQMEDFEGEPIENLRGVATLYPETIHVVTDPEANIETMADLEGATVNTGDLGSGTQVDAQILLEAVAGLTTDDFDEENTDFGQAADQLRDGDIDAAFVVGGWPVGAIEELATSVEIDILEISGDDRQAALDAEDFFAEDTVPGGTYDGIDEDVETVSVQAMIATREEYDADAVEELTAAIFDNVDELQTKADFIDAETAQDGMSIELHEGAARYFEE